MTTRRHPEADLQRTVVELLRRFAHDDVIWFHVPNGEHRNKATGARLKAMGVLAGVADLILFLPFGTVRCLELKTGHGTLSPAQRAFSNACANNGTDYQMARGIEEAVEWLWKWGALKSHPFRRTK